MDYTVSPRNPLSLRESLLPLRLQPYLSLSLIVLVGLGMLLRFKGVSTLSLWLDETAVVNALCSDGGIGKYFKNPMVQRPLLYLMLSECLLGFHNTELFARLSSLIPSLLSLLVMVPLSLRLFTNRAVAIFSVFLLAVNPYLINAAKDFKPYALEHFLCLLLLFFVVSWWRQGQKKYIYYYCLTAILAPPLGQPFLFIVPSFSVVLLYELYTAKDKRLLWLVLAATVVAIGWYAGLYSLVFREMNTSKVTTFEENLYHGGGLWHAVPWVLNHLRSMFTEFVPGRNFLGYDAAFAMPTKGMVAAGVLFFGLRVVLNHEWKLFVLLFFPLLLSAMMSIVLAWPFGVARTNIYAIGLLLVIVMIGIEYFLNTFDSKILNTATVAALILIMFPYNINFYDKKYEYYWTPNEEFVSGVTELIEYTKHNAIAPATTSQNPVIVFNLAADSQYKYYTEHHSLLAKKYQAYFNNFDTKFINSRDINDVGKFIAAELAKNASVFFMFSHYQPQEMQALLDILYSPYVTLFFERNLPQTYVVHAGFRRK